MTVLYVHYFGSDKRYICASKTTPTEVKMQFSDKQAYGYIAPANGYLKLGVAVKKRLDKMGKGGEKVSKGRKISLQELSTHRTPEDGNRLANFQSLRVEATVMTLQYLIFSAWLSYQGKVYDVSGWEDHPGASTAMFHMIGTLF